MRKFTRLVVACAAVITVTALTACSENGNAPAQEQQTPTTQSVQSTAAASSQPAQSSQEQSAETSSTVSSSVNSSSTASSSTAPQSAPAEGFPENPSEASIVYFKDAVGIVDKYLCIILSNEDELDELGIWELYDTDEAAAMQKEKEYLLDCAKKGEGYLDELEKLTPTKEMSAFHNGLVSLMSVMRDYSGIAKALETLDMTDEAAVEDFLNKVDLLFARFNEEYKAFYVKYPGFGSTLAEGEWTKNGSTVKQYFKADLIENARETARELLTVVNYWLIDNQNYGGKPPSNVTLNITHTEYSCKVTVEGGELQTAPKNDTELGDAIYRNYPINETFYARVFINEDGYAVYAMVSPDGELDESEYPDWGAFENQKWKWKQAGITPKGHILGTLPWISADNG